MIVDANFRNLIEPMEVALECSLDPVCVVDRENRIVYINAPMRTLLKTNKRALQAGQKFCDVMKLAACAKSCCIVKVMESGEGLRLDETFATSPNGKMRVVLKAVPIRSTDPQNGVAGALITVRDSTGEILLQAKYHKSSQIIAGLEQQLSDLGEKYRDMQERLRRAAYQRISK
jgi:transcriptional regulator with PAS, ATPase and Fis domain